MNYLTTACGTNTLVDADTADKYRHLKFRLIKGYVAYDEKHRTKKLHRLVINAKDGEEVDHINRNKLDNRRINLRICTRQENLMNRGGWGKIPIKGITWNKQKQKFVARHFGPQKTGEHIGYFTTLEEAKKALGVS